MADNTQLNTGTGGDTIRDKDRAGVKTQIVGLDLNPAGSEVLGTGDATNGLDVDVTRVQGTVTVAGTVTANLAAGTNNIGDVDVLTTPTAAADNGTLPAVVDVVGGYDGTNVQVVKTDVNGIVQTAVNGAIPAGANTIGKVDQGTGGASAWKVDGSAVTQPVSAASLPLPTGAATAAKQPALGTAGAPSTDVLTVQGSASGTPLPVSVSSPAASVVSTSNSSTATLGAAGVFTGTSEQVKDYAIIVVSVWASHASATDGLSVQQSSDGTNWDIVDTYTIPATTGKTFTFQPAARYFRVVYTNGGTIQTGFRLQSIFHYEVTKASSQRPSDAYTNETDVEQVTAFAHLFNGTTWDRVRGDITNGLDVDVTRLPALASGTNLVGRVNPEPQTANGLTPSMTISAASTNATSVKASAGQVYSVFVTNTNAAARYLKLYNKASAPTVGTDTPVAVFAIPGNTAGAGLSWSTDMGVAFGTGIAFALTTGVANSDTGAVAANEVVVNLFYK